MQRWCPQQLRHAGGLARSLFIYWRPGRQRGLKRLYQPFIVSNKPAFDIGAHLGDRSAAFNALGARVVALEPQPALAKWFKRMIKRQMSRYYRWPQDPPRGLLKLPLAKATPRFRHWRLTGASRLVNATQALAKYAGNNGFACPSLLWIS